MWPFRKKKPKQLPAPSQNKYVLAKLAGMVDHVQTGLVIVEGKEHKCKATLVRPGQEVRKGQPVGKG
tara:strand:+ start:30052 stop:30252 length:201 start_codon:yes stop_codon:yes gene_type:complete